MHNNHLESYHRKDQLHSHTCFEAHSLSRNPFLLNVLSKTNVRCLINCIWAVNEYHESSDCALKSLWKMYFRSADKAQFPSLPFFPLSFWHLCHSCICLTASSPRWEEQISTFNVRRDISCCGTFVLDFLPTETITHVRSYGVCQICPSSSAPAASAHCGLVRFRATRLLPQTQRSWTHTTAASMSLWRCRPRIKPFRQLPCLIGNVWDSLEAASSVTQQLGGIPQWDWE